ncbi:MAG: HNH endonuclease [Clostridia bacterium]|nr:HNH endonuclease [Clostridia bacterium]
MKEYARTFYKGKKWRECSAAYMASKQYVCERCGGVAVICHHRRHITPANITDPNITYNWGNLEALCQDCHNKEHMQKNTKIIFDDAGQVEKVKDGAQVRDFKQACNHIDALLSKFDRVESP